MNTFTKNLTLLYVEDDLLTAQQTVRLFERLFKKVILCNNGQEALGCLEKHKNINLIITDITMPVMNGIDMIKIITQHTDDFVPVIALTAHTQSYLEELSILNIIHIDKPLSLPKLLLYIEKLFPQNQPIGKIVLHDSYDRLKI